MFTQGFFTTTFLASGLLTCLLGSAVSVGQVESGYHWRAPAPAGDPVYASAQGSFQGALAQNAIVNDTPDCGCDAPVATPQSTPCGCGKTRCDGRLCHKRKSKPASKPNPCAGSHKGLFYANDFSYLGKDDYCGNCLGDQFKQIPVGKCGKLDLGGELRYRYHSERGMGRQAGRLGFQDTENNFGLTRLRLYGNYKVNNDIRLYAEGIYADVTNSDGLYVPRPIDANRGDFLNLFADIALTEDTLVRVGRQELLFGAQRLVSPLDWANTRRTFDGVRTITNVGDMKLEMFYTQFVPVDVDSFDTPDENQDFYGAYATFTGMENATVESYVLGYNNDNTGAPVASNFDLVTFGSRIFGSTKDKVLYEAEGSFQTGVQNGLGVNHEAFAWMGGLGYQFANHPWKPTVWGFYDFASGNDPGDADFNRFNQLYPLAHKYLGFIDAVARSNISSPNVRMTMSPAKKLDVLLWYHNFRAEESGDIVPGVAVPSAQNLTDSDFGNELDCLVTYQLTARSNVAAGYSHLWRGTKIIGTNDADFFYLQATTRF